MEYYFWCYKWCNGLEMNLLFDVKVTPFQCKSYTILVLQVGDGLSKSEVRDTRTPTNTHSI